MPQVSADDTLQVKLRPSRRGASPDAIGQATFSTKEAGRVVYLAIDSKEIKRIGGKLDLEAGKAYESCRAAVIAEVRYDWSFPDRTLRDGEFPAYRGLLAAQVVAAFQMHNNGHPGAPAYWKRLRGSGFCMGRACWEIGPHASPSRPLQKPRVRPFPTSWRP